MQAGRLRVGVQGHSQPLLPALLVHKLCTHLQQLPDLPAVQQITNSSVRVLRNLPESFAGGSTCRQHRLNASLKQTGNVGKIEC